MIMVHDPAQEKNFLTNGYGVNRKIIAYNFFIIVGPPNDPAGVNGMAPIDSLKRIAQLGQNGQAIWVSRNDGSGTNSKEKTLWASAGYNYTQLTLETSWFKSTGQGMGATLTYTNENNGYTISDTGTYLAFYGPGQGQIQLKTIVQAHKDLLNVYSVIIDNPQNANLTGINFDAAKLFVQYMVSDEGQQLLSNYGVSSYGQSLFSPFVPLANGASPNATLLSWIQNYAYIPANITECPAEYRYNADNLYAPSYDTLSNSNLAASISLPNYYSTNRQQFVLAQPLTYSLRKVKATLN